jgi:hypothetical protein
MAAGTGSRELAEDMIERHMVLGMEVGFGRAPAPRVGDGAAWIGLRASQN